MEENARPFVEQILQMCEKRYDVCPIALAFRGKYDRIAKDLKMTVGELEGGLYRIQEVRIQEASKRMREHGVDYFAEFLEGSHTGIPFVKIFRDTDPIGIISVSRVNDPLHPRIVERNEIIRMGTYLRSSGHELGSFQ